MSASSQAVGSAATLRYRFGPFELDLQSGELRRNGVKLRLQDQPFLVLRKLLEGNGAVVSREELHSTLWPADTFVDFDTSLNTAIKRLREVLGDSADVPVFIETIPRRGYRFLAPVQVIRSGELSPAIRAAGEPAASGKSWRAGLILGGLIAGALAGGLTVTLRSPAPLPRVLDSTQLTFDGHPKGNLNASSGAIYFNERVGNRIRLLKMPEAGGIPVVLDSSFPGLDLGDVSSDGTKLLVGMSGSASMTFEKLRLMDLSSGSVQDVGNIEGNDASWTPGGKLIYAHDRDIFLADADGSNQHRLLTAPGYVFFLRFSPDGSRLRFSVGGKYATQHSIWEARADGSAAHEILTELTEFPDRCCGGWSADGRYFFFETLRDGGGRIWAQAEKRSFWTGKQAAPVDLTTVPPNYFIGKAGPDGRKLFVMAAQPRAELVRYNSATEQFVPFLSGISAGDVEASHDASSFVYVRYPEETLWRCKPDGTEATQLTGPTLRAALPHWAPDGKHIAFSGTRPGKPWNIFLIPAEGGPAEQLTYGPISDLDPTWSPDGKTLAFGEMRTEGNRQIPSIRLLDVATRSQKSLAGSDGICCPRWSPDGRFLVTSHETYNDLALYEFATQKWTALVKGIGDIGYMEWASDSKSVIFDTMDVKEQAFYRARISDSHLETIAKIGDMRRYYGEFGPWTGMAPDGSPLLVRDISNEEIYSLDLLLP
jgi:Tol biopolymer transport system component/DNA-binding winged helix-turn-helix (wHTH) protein